MSGDRLPTESDFHLSEDLCLDLVHGLLAPAVRKQAVDHARECIACARMLREFVDAHERSRARSMEWLRPGGSVDHDPSSRPPVPVHRAQEPRYRVMMLAAVFLMVVAGGFLLFRVPRSATPHLEPAWLPMATPRGDVRDPAESGIDSEIARGLEAYERRNLPEAVEILRGRSVTGSSETVRRLYLASALVGTGAYEEALAIVPDLMETELPDPWRSESEWIRAVALARLGRVSSADSVLQELEDGDGPLADRARSARGGRAPLK